MLKRMTCWVLAFVAVPALLHGQTKLNHVVLGYSAVWRDEGNGPAQMQIAGLTYIARAFLHPQADGSINVPSGYFPPTLEDAAKAHGVKLLMSLGGGADAAENWIAMASNPASRERFLDRIDQLMREHHYDGVDIDWEPMPERPQPALAYTTLLKDLRQRFPHAVLTTALDDWVDGLNWPDVIASVDYINAMTYDYTGPWTGIAGEATNLHAAGDYHSVPGHSVEEGMHKLIDVDHIPPAKLLLGMNFYGYRFRTDRLGEPFAKNNPHSSDDVTYQQVQDLLETGHYQKQWDAAAAVPYLQRSGGGSVISFDDPESIRLKCDFARQRGCAGVMIWNVGADVCAAQMPLTDAVLQSFGGRPAELDRSSLEAEVAAVQQSLPPDVPGEAGGGSHSAPLQSLSLQQLQTLSAQLRLRAGQQDDLQWQQQAPQRH